MASNPYQSPEDSEPQKRRPNWWKRACIAASAILAACILVLSLMGDVTPRGGIVFRYGDLAFRLVIVALCAVPAAAITGLGWLVKNWVRR